MVNVTKTINNASDFTAYSKSVIDPTTKIVVTVNINIILIAKHIALINFISYLS